MLNFHISAPYATVLLTIGLYISNSNNNNINNNNNNNNNNESSSSSADERHSAGWKLQ